MKLPCLFQFRILKLAITSFFSQPFTTRFPYAPYEPIPQFRGRPRYHKDDCIGCGACENACPVRDRPAIRVSAVGESRSAASRLLLSDTAERNRR